MPHVSDSYDGSFEKAPNFFLVGAPKAGTTSLYRYLDQHPQIYMSPVKEPHFMAEEVRLPNFSPEVQNSIKASRAELRKYLDGSMTSKFLGGYIDDWRDYRKLFAAATDQKARGDASVCCLWSRTAAANIRRHFPDARILMVLRNPADRAFAQYVHMLALAKNRVSFSEMLSRSSKPADGLMSETWPLLEFGLYFEQVKRYLELFPADRIHIGLYEDFEGNPMVFMQAIFAFLGVDSSFRPDLSERHMMARVPRSYSFNRLLVWLRPMLRRVSPRGLRAAMGRLVFRPRAELTMAPAERASLAGFYRDDVRKLAALLNRDLSTWL